MSSALIRHPRRVLFVAAVCLAVLGFLGRGVEDKLIPAALGMSGTESSRAESQLKEHFGPSSSFAVLLRGPAAQLDSQGPRFVRELRRDPAVTTLSPWGRGFVDGLRPNPGAALIVVNFEVGIGEAVEEANPHLHELVKSELSAPVRGTVTGFATIRAGTQQASKEAGKRGEMIAIPLLLIVLLLVLRSPVAAAVPVALGVATVIATRGIIAVLSRWIDIDPAAPPVASMMGLALGVDYALLMVSRFREELKTAVSPMAAAAETRHTAGRTILIAGSTLLVALLVSFLALPRGLFTSLNGAAVLATVISVPMAWTVGTAALTLLGGNVDRWRIGGERPPRTRLMTLVQAALRRPARVTFAITALMLLAVVPMLSIALGSPGLEQLPKDNQVRRDAEVVGRAAGPGWATPFVVVASVEEGSIARQGRLDALDRWQRQTSHAPGVRTVIGPGRVAQNLRPLRSQANALIAGGPNSGLAGTQKLGANLGRAAGGVAQLRSGLAQASQGAGLLGTGSQRAATGAAALAEGVNKAASGGERAAGAIGQMSAGTRRLVAGQQSARFGALQLELGLKELRPDMAKGGLGIARPLLADLERRAESQPELQEDVDRAADLVIQFTRAKHEVTRLRRLSAKLYEGLGQLASGGTKLQDGVARLAQASKRLGGGLRKLGGGSEQLASGISRLSGGAGVLEQKLAEGFHLSSPLEQGLRKSSVKVAAKSRRLNGNVNRLRGFSPGIFDSGFFALAALDGAPPGARRDAGQVLAVAGGGTAARMLVIGDSTSVDAGDLYADLQRRADGLSRDAGLDVAVGGDGAQLIDYGVFTRERLPLLILMVSFATFLMLVFFLRSLLLPAIAVLLNLVTVAVSFGVLSLVSRIPAGYPMGGNRIIDVGAAMLIFTVAFSLSIDYAVFLVTRMREVYEEEGDHKRAIYVGLERTARVVTGAAVVMGAVFLTYGSAPVAILSQIGVGLAVAVLLDATVIRVVLLPALMLLLGDRVWWLPAPLARLLPRLGTH